MSEPTVYEGPERRQNPRPPIVVPRNAALAVAVAVWLGIMLPLGFVLFYGWRSDERATRSQEAACTLVSLLDSQQLVIDRTSRLLAAGLALANDTVVDRDRAQADMAAAIAAMGDAEDRNAAVLAVAQRHDLPCAT